MHQGLKNKKSDSGHKAFFIGKKEIRLPYKFIDIKKCLLDNIEILNDREKHWLKNFNSFDNIVWTPQETSRLNHISEFLEQCRYLLYRFSFKYFPENYVLDIAPLHVLIEPTSVCNLRCPMCFQVDKTFTTKEYMGSMEIETFSEIWKQINDFKIPSVSISSRGEPTIHPKFEKILDIISNKHDKLYDLKLNTNGTRLKENRIEKILDSGINIINVGVDSHEKKLYEELRKNANFEKTFNNIKLLKEIRDKNFNNRGIELRISGVNFDDRQNFKQFGKFWKKYTDNVVFVEAQERWDIYNNKKTNSDLPCSFLWERLFVWYDGKVNTCDEDYKSKLSPGNILKNDLTSIWNNDIMNQYRKNHINRKRCVLEPCTRCSV